MNILKAFEDFIKQQDLFQPKDKLLLAVSGGVDSVVMCELCKQAGFEFVIAHCNFQLRGAESERDEKFVRSLGNKCGVEVAVKRFDTAQYATANKCSIQVAARELRYTWFKELAASMNIGHILTAHHANDNLETMLMNFFKGTGINGLHGILAKQGMVIRPLLFAKKEALTGFAIANKLEYVEDSSNASDKYSRNYFRNELIPALEKVYPQVEENLLNNIDRFREVEILYRQSIESHKQKLLVQKGGEIHIPVLKLQKSKPLNTIIYEIIKDLGFTTGQVDEVVSLIKSESGKYVQSPTHRVLKDRNWLIISKLNTIETQHILIEKNDKKVKFEGGELVINTLVTTNHKPQTTNTTAELDADEIKFPLLLRKWKQGDYFYPLGLQAGSTGRPGKKKLSRFFIDQKLSLNQKEQVWVIEMNKKIIWVVGMRIDDRFKIKPSTKNIIQFSLSITK